MSDLVGDYADPRYLQLATEGVEGVAELARAGLAFGLTVNEDGRPTQLLTMDGPARLVMIDASTPMQRITNDDIVSLVLNDDSVPGLVVVRDLRAVGILSADILSDYSLEHPPSSFGLMGDEQLHGRAPATPLSLICSTCQTHNVVPFFAAGVTRCSQGHPLTIAWD